MTLFMGFEPLPGNAEIIIEFASLMARAEDFAPAFTLVVESFHQTEAQRWTSEGPGWPELAPNTIYQKEMLGYGDVGILVRDGTLEDSLAGDSGITEITTSYVEMGTDVPYAIFHDDGMGHNPLRKLVDIDAGIIEVWLQILQAYLSAGEE